MNYYKRAIRSSMAKSVFIYKAFVALSFVAGISIDTLAQGRKEIDFNQGWLFKKGAKDYEKGVSFSLEEWKEVTVPHTYNSEDMQLGKDFYTGDGFYHKEFTVADSLKEKRLFLRFEGVGSVAQVYVNGRFLGEHKGSYSAFAFEITHSVNYGEKNTILVKTNNEARKDVLPVNHFLFPIYGGIYRPVSLIITNKVNIKVTDHASPGIFIRQKDISDKQATISVKAKLENKEIASKSVSLRIEVKDAKGKSIKVIEEPLAIRPQGVTVGEQEFTVKNPHLWQGVEDPYLYTLTTSLEDGDRVLDAVTQFLGIRSVEIKPGKGVFLNGKAYPMHGVTRHQDRWGYGNALSRSQHLEDMLLIKEIGATTIRLAHYQQAEDMYSIADSLGFLIWAEIPFVNTYTSEEAANAKQQMTELVRQNSNHPSIYIWGIHNEVYSKTEDEYVAVLSRELNDIAKTNDPDRPTVAVSGYGEMWRPANLSTDVQGMNRYYGWYEGKIDDLEQWVEGLEEAYPEHIVMLAEYGADGNMDQGAEKLPGSRNPVNGKFFPENYQTETHIQQWAIIEDHPYITASYLWNMFEFAVPMWNRGGVNARNLKGLVTFDRKRKKDSFYWYKANWNPEPMIHLANSRDNKRTEANTTVQLFTNLSSVELIVNGQKITKELSGVNKHHKKFEVMLQKGNNLIMAEGQDDAGKVISDKMEWVLD
ncbi:glycoside hydrolase family 2 protein [Echinicola shivajiensis]|uniref:glycoside hydrolase family 2 protein n=1 Tax=Echinicola shivajiensis TaxID=1035916 RepID=UPI001BFCC568|nr:glycoside hydrolase family 2 TIM barrel-domain containing protein [Echinicola shivajiensis]